MADSDSARLLTSVLRDLGQSVPETTQVLQLLRDIADDADLGDCFEPKVVQYDREISRAWMRDYLDFVLTGVHGNQ